MPVIEIDGQQLEVAAGSTIIEAADAAGIPIPRFCYHPNLSVVANCRMCMVEVEQAPKPLPACATQIADGMKVSTKSSLARGAQKGTLEFLLLNHPLDCPICDQGGECPLQDQAYEYGSDYSRYQHKKRSVVDQDIGPLVQTHMTRCIHCTRCIRFGEEVAGVMELGAIGRGEHTRIVTFLEQRLDSEVSGNVIDLCPVGALTSKPYRFSTRSWEMNEHFAVSPHDCVGSNLRVQHLRNHLKRVLPHENSKINDVWLSDRDRFSYEGVLHKDRVTSPMQRIDNQWQEIDWQTAIAKAAGYVKQADAESVGALIAPGATLEEFYLLQKIIRALGSNNIDHRLRQVDFSHDAEAGDYPGGDLAIAEIDSLKRIILLGSNIRKEQPMLGLRVRQAELNGAKIVSLDTASHPQNFHLQHQWTTTPDQLLGDLVAIAEIISAKTGIASPSDDWKLEIPETAQQRAESFIAQILQTDEKGAIIIGTRISHHHHYHALLTLAQWVAEHCQMSVLQLSEGNSVAAWVAGAIPHRLENATALSTPGKNVQQMLTEPLQTTILFATDPTRDSAYAQAGAILRRSKVIAICQYFQEAESYADLILPMSTFVETPGSYINCEGKVQTVTGALPLPGDAKIGWKILRVLANALELPGFSYITETEIRNELSPVLSANTKQRKPVQQLNMQASFSSNGKLLQSINDISIYAVDPVVRHADSLQATTDNIQPAIYMNRQQLDRLSLQDNEKVQVVADHSGTAMLPVLPHEQIPDQCALVPSGSAITSSLAGARYLTVEKASE